MKKLLGLLLALLTPALSLGQAWSGIIAPSRAIDWKNVGISAGNYGNVPHNTTICATLGTAGQASTFAQSVTAAQVNSAITSCGVNQVVFLNPGTYTFSAGIGVSGKSNYTLRGSGPTRTIVKFTGGSGFSFSQSTDVGIEGTTLNYGPAPNHLTTWTAGYSVGNNVVTLGSVAGLNPGQLIILDQANDTIDGGAVFVCDNNDAPVPPSLGPNNNPSGALVGCNSDGNGPTGSGRSVGVLDFSEQQLVKVVSINGNNVTIDRPLYMPNWRSGQTPGAWWASSNVSNVGVEDITFDHTASVGMQFGIMFFNAYSCWVKNVRGLFSNRANVEIYLSARIVVRDSYFYGVSNGQGNGSQSYGVETFQGSDNLVINNIFQHVTTPLMLNTVEGNVYAYNYDLDNFQVGGSGGFQFAGPNFNHSAGSDMNLEEGDVGIQHLDDAIHGSKQFNTMFRSFMHGRDPGFSSETAAVILMSHARFMNHIGNVFGEAGYHNTYQVTAGGATTNCNTAIYNIGWPSTSCLQDSVGTSTSRVPNDPIVASSLMRWGNWDVVNNASRFVAGEVPSGLSSFANPVPASNNLPTSLFLVIGAVPYTSPPTWWATAFGTPAWPPIGPDVTGGTVTSGTGTGSTLGGHVYAIPAMLCQNHLPADTTNYPGSNPAILAYDALTCYTSESLTTPDNPANTSTLAPPTNVIAIPGVKPGGDL